VTENSLSYEKLCSRPHLHKETKVILTKSFVRMGDAYVQLKNRVTLLLLSGGSLVV